MRERERVYVMSVVCEAEKSVVKVCFVPLRNEEDAPMTCQWHGRTSVSRHLLRDKLGST